MHWRKYFILFIPALLIFILLIQNSLPNQSIMSSPPLDPKVITHAFLVLHIFFIGVELLCTEILNIFNRLFTKSIGRQADWTEQHVENLQNGY